MHRVVRIVASVHKAKTGMPRSTPWSQPSAASGTSNSNTALVKYYATGVGTP